MSRRNAFSLHRSAFTLVELLIVIAIISILVAIIFPVFASILENGRESNTMSKMQQISSALELYKLDNHYYPPVLYGYAMPDPANPGSYIPMGNVAGQSGSATYLVGLYPQYIKDWHVFTNNNNALDDQAAAVSVNTNTFPTTGSDLRALSVMSPQPAFYKMDAYDISPQITAINQTSTTVFVPRYQTSWTSYPAGSTPSVDYPDATSPDPDYSRQLRWELPPANTYVTSTTYHVGNANRALVLFQSGTVKKVNIVEGAWNPVALTNYTLQESQYIDGNGDISAVAASGGRPNAQASFWRFTGGQ